MALMITLAVQLLELQLAGGLPRAGRQQGHHALLAGRRLHLHRGGPRPRHGRARRRGDLYDDDDDDDDDDDQVTYYRGQDTSSRGWSGSGRILSSTRVTPESKIIKVNQAINRY